MSDSPTQSAATMISRMAEALEAQDALLTAGSWRWEVMARAVLNAMREPTENMLESDQISRVGLNDAYRLHASPNYGAAWTALIDAALTDDFA